MPNALTHIVIGGVAGATVNVIMQTGRMVAHPSTKFDWGEFGVCVAAAASAALLPDLLEPADSPNHRGFFHSVAMAGIVAFLMSGKHTEKWPWPVKLLVCLAGVGYLSHLAADSLTPKSIRWI